MSSDEHGPRVLPAAVRYPLLVVLVGAALIGLVVALYDRGVLPIAGPFVAMVAAAVIVYVVLWARSLRLRRLAGRARVLLERLRGELVSGGVAGSGVAGGAGVVADVDAGLQQLAWGHEAGVVEPLRRLAAASQAWGDGPARRTAQELGGVAESIATTVARMRKVAGQRADGGRPPSA